MMFFRRFIFSFLLLYGILLSTFSYAENVSLNASEHNTYARLHFIWPSEIFYKAQINGNKLEITFAKPIDTDVSFFTNEIPAYIKEATKEEEGHKITFTLSKNDFSLRNSSNKGSIFIDLIGKGDGTVKTAPKNETEQKNSLSPSPSPVLPKEVQASTPSATPKTESTPIPTTKPIPVPEPKPEPTPQAQSITNTEIAPANPTIEKEPPVPTPAPQEPVLTSSLETPIATKEEEAETIEQKTSDSDFLTEIANAKKESSIFKKPSLTLSFPQRTILPTAVFKKNGYLWVVYNSTEPLDLSLLKRLGGKTIKEITQFPSQTATIIRILMPPELNPTVRREGTLLILDIAPEETGPTFPLDIRPQSYSGLENRLFIPISGSAKPITLRDPSVGDTMQIIPVIPLSRGIDSTRIYPEADLLKTWQGVVLVPKADMTEARTSNSGIEILHRNKDFLISKIDKKPTIRNDYTDALGIKDWGYVEPEEFTKEREQIQTLPLLVEKNKKDLARLEYARFLFANQQIPEALGILHLIESTSPATTESRAFKAMAGVSNFMMYRFKEAEEYLSSSMLDGDDEVALWRALTKMFTGEPSEQVSVIKANLGFLKEYPNWLKNKLGFIALEAALATEDDLAVQNFLEIVDNENTNSYQLAGIEYYKGKLGELTGSFSAAIENYRNAENGHSRYYDALAGLARIKLQILTGELSSQDAAEELENHRFAWREEAYEIDVLSKLVEIYLLNKEFGKAMRIMKELSTFFKDTEAGKNSEQQLKDLFAKLCLSDKDEDISTLKLIALFEEFKELIPKNKTGDEIIRRLADRMVAVDLLPRATELLEAQMDNPRVDETEKVLIGTRLALINLLSRQPQKALNALDISETDTIEEPLKSNRLYIRAKTLAELGKIEEALTLIKDSKEKEALALKTEILWKEKRWAEVSEVIRRTIKKPVSHRPLTDEEAQTIMYWVVAMKLAGEDSSVAIARKNFLPYMKNTKYFNGFNLVSSDKPVGIMDYKTINQEIKTTENFRNFLKEYSDKLKESSLSDVIK